LERRPWREIAARFWDDRLEQAALAHASGNSPRDTSEAIQILGSYGSAGIKESLLERLAQWERAWRGRAGELDALQRPPLDSSEQIENALVNALFQNRNITLIAEDVMRIKALCMTDRCRSNVDALARHR
jgi:hypothetical protein